MGGTGTLRVRFAANALKPLAQARLAELAALARDAGLAVTDGSGADAVIALGGDGTILRAARENPDLPVLGFNFGSLGYLASVEQHDFPRAFRLLAEGRWTVRRRTMLAVSKGGSAPRTALNDVVVVREMTGHAAVLDLSADGRAAARYVADGLVVATPTGSTAYSLSAGGPVLLPDAPCFVVTPMNPHALGVRPLVLPDGVRLTVASRRRLAGADERVGVYADGEAAFLLDADESVEIRRADRPAAFVELEGFDPYAVMARKLGWKGGDRS